MKLSHLLEESKSLADIKPEAGAFFRIVTEDDPDGYTDGHVCACAVGILAYMSNNERVLYIPNTNIPVNVYHYQGMLNNAIIRHTGHDLLSILVKGTNDEDKDLAIEPHPVHADYMDDDGLNLFDALIYLFDKEGLDETIKWLRENNL